MPGPQSRPADTYSPLYYLASLGAGGLAVTFFMYLMFWVPHPGRPVPVFEDIVAAWQAGGLPMRAAILVAMTGILGFAILNLRALAWNLASHARFRGSDAHRTLLAGNGETQFLALPLALAMTVNAGFILGLVFVPGLWGIVEYLFPAALAGFAAIGGLALLMTGRFLARVFGEAGGFDPEANNSFAQLMPAFALSMVAVGLAAPAAMSTVPATVGTSLVLSTAFGTLAALYAVAAGLAAIGPMLRHGIALEAAPTLMVVVPILTVLGIMALRQAHGLHTTFAVHAADGSTLVLLTRILAVQLAVGLLGLAVLVRQGYAATFLAGDRASAGAYALVCPGVALSVMLHFWISKGLVANGLIESFGVAFWGLTAVAVALQAAMVVLVLYLNRRHFGRRAAAAAVAAE